MKYLFIALTLGLSWSFLYNPVSPNAASPDALIKGQVTDAYSGKPVANATVVIKAESNSVTCDNSGHFAIRTTRLPAKLFISAPGYKASTIKIRKEESNLSVSLIADVREEEVVITGYSPNADAAKDLPSRLQGRVQGIQISKSSAKRRLYPSAPDFNTEEYASNAENIFLSAKENPLSTFSIDVDGASYSNVRRFIQSGQLPPAGSVRVEEMINYFHYNYPQPAGMDPFSINTEIAACPWNRSHQLVMIGLQGKNIPLENLPAANLVFLIDVSGSMMDENKLPLVKSSLKLLVSQLREKDRVAIVVYAGNAGLVLPSTPGNEKEKICNAIESLEAGGSTAGGEGILLAYSAAKQNFIANGNNRVILCTDGDFNVGPSSDADLVKIIEEKRKSGVFLTVLGYGMGNYKDSKMELLAGKGNGNHSYIDNLNEAKKVLVHEFGSTLFTIAKDVKLQVEFNPLKVQAYRLVGYENRLLNKEDFNNDQKDAGELGSGHTVTALYEIIPFGVVNEFGEKVDPLKYQQPASIGHGVVSNELMTIKFRYKQPAGDKSQLIVHSVTDKNMENSSENFKFASAVAEFGMLLNNSKFRQQSSFEGIRSIAKYTIQNDREGYRAEFFDLVKRAERLVSAASLSKRD